METKATKRHWSIRPLRNGFFEVWDEIGCLVVTTSTSTEAALIVRAVNSHEALVEACEQLLKDVDHGYRPIEGCLCVALARAALAMAKENV